MQTNEELINEMISKGVLQTPRIIDAFKVIDRKYFIPQEFADLTYIDRPLPIGKNQTISQPSTVAFMLEQLQVKEGDEVLDIGVGGVVMKKFLKQNTTTISVIFYALVGLVMTS